MNEARPTRVVNCPICGKSVPWTLQSPFRPFCSERCQEIDLGAWAAEAYLMPEATTAGDLDPEVLA